MDAGLERRWDEAMETAWRSFRQRLADRLAGMAEDDALVVAVPGEASDGASPYCQAVVGPGLLRVEAVSNVYLSTELRLDSSQELALRAIGFLEPGHQNCPGETNHWADLDRREADRAAVMMVRALREVYAVLHPVYLDADGLEPRAAEPPPPVGASDEPLRPQGPDDVRAAVDLAVRDLIASAPEWDADGDLTLHTARGLVWVFVSKAAPRILLQAPLVDDVADESRALMEVNLLNRKEIGLTFSVHEGHVTVRRELDVAALVPAHVRSEIQRLLDGVDDWAADLVARVGGRRMDEVTPRPAPGPQAGAEETRFHAAYAVLRELEKEERGSVDPATMARVFQQDTGLLLKGIRVTEGLVRQWQRRERQYDQAGKQSAAKLARARQRMHRDVRSRMRLALRLLVDAPLRKVPTGQLALFDEDECGRSR